MSFANSIIAAVLETALSPFRDQSPLVSLTLVSAASALIMLLIVKATSNQTRLAAVKRSIQACVYEVRLFGHDAPAMFRALGEMLRHNLTYARLSLVPLLWMALPMGLLLVHLDTYYGVGAQALARPALVKVTVMDPSGPLPRLEVPDGVRLESPAVWIPSLREVAWRISAERPGDFELAVRVGDSVVTKHFSTTSGITKRSQVRSGGGILDQLRHPAERPLPGDAGIASIAVTYPTGSISVFGWEAHWLVVFFVLSMVFAFVLRSPLKVVI